MARRKIPTTVYLNPEQERALKLLHGRTKVPMAEYIRQGIDLILVKNHIQLPGQLDLFHTRGSPKEEAKVNNAEGI